MTGKTKCVYHSCCTKYPECPKGHGDKTEDYSCLRQRFEDDKSWGEFLRGKAAARGE